MTLTSEIEPQKQRKKKTSKNKEEKIEKPPVEKKKKKDRFVGGVSIQYYKDFPVEERQHFTVSISSTF
jgi:hypothetical protein